MTARATRTRYIRPGMLPAVLGAATLLATIGIIHTDFYLYVRYAVSILALIVIVIAIQHGKWWWGLPMAPLVVMWNPAWPFGLTEELWQVLVLLGSAVFIATGVMFRVIDTSEPPPQRDGESTGAGSVLSNASGGPGNR